MNRYSQSGFHLNLAIILFSITAALCGCTDRNTPFMPPDTTPPQDQIMPNWQISAALDQSLVNAVITTDNNYIVAATEDGNIFRSKNRTKSWAKISLATQPIKHLSIGPAGNTYAVVKHQGLFYSVNNAKDWMPLSGSPAEIILIEQLPNGNLMAAEEHQLYLSEDQGATWRTLSSGIDEQLSFTLLKALDDQIIFAGTNLGLFRSADGGQSWQEVLANRHILCMAINANQVIFTGTNANGVYRSADSGGNWLPRQNGFDAKRVFAVAFGVNGQVFAGTLRTGVFYSSNSGTSWQSFGLGSEAIYQLHFNREDNTIYAGSGHVVYRHEFDE